MDRYTLRDLIQDFGTTTQCLEFLRKRRWPDGIFCHKCGKITRHHLRTSHKSYSCQYCGTMISPTIGTILHRSKISLPDWMYTIYTLASTRTGVASAQISRELGLGYKAALRMVNRIRACLEEAHAPITGIAECDETYVGGKPRKRGVSKRGRGAKKTKVFAVVERGGIASAKVVPNVQRATLMPIVQEHVAEGATVYTDEFNVYAKLDELGYKHDTVKHKENEYVKYKENGEVVHTNCAEGFFQSPKGAIRSVHRGVLDQRMQGYWNEYCYRYSLRNDTGHMFFSIIDRILEAPISAQAA